VSTVNFEGVTKEFANGFRAVIGLDLDVGDGELLVVVGPSGCGKTTTLRMLAGLEDITEGKISIGDRVVNDVVARDRDIAMVFQSYALYPHLSVSGNLAYPLKIAGMPKHERDSRVLEVAKQLRLVELLDRKPRELSGGQRQRVAMGRAMVRQPKVFLMDEPLSNLDAKLRVAMRAEVSELQRGLNATMFYVTHDQVEAMTMGDRVAVMDRGILQQVSTPNDLYEHPNSVFVAGFIGSPPMNRIVATVRADGPDAMRIVSGTGVATVPLATLSGSPLLQAARSGRVILGARPEHIGLADAEHGWPGIVRLVEQLGSEQNIHLDIEGLEFYDPEKLDQDTGAPPRLIVSLRDDTSAIRPGDVVHVTVAPRHVHVFDAETGLAITG
jgi:multiple sugar transport system ATP-binding protein